MDIILFGYLHEAPHLVPFLCSHAMHDNPVLIMKACDLVSSTVCAPENQGGIASSTSPCLQQKFC